MSVRKVFSFYFRRSNKIEEKEISVEHYVIPLSTFIALTVYNNDMNVKTLCDKNIPHADRSDPNIKIKTKKSMCFHINVDDDYVLHKNFC